MQRRSCIRAAVTQLVAALLAAGPAHGQSFDDLPASAAELGAAGGRLVGLGEASALWVNAAELVDVTALASVSLGLQSASRVVDHDAAVFASRDAGAPIIAPAAALALPLLDRRLALAAGYRLLRRIDSHYLRPTLVAAADAPAAPDPVRYLGSELTLEDHRFALGLALRLGALRLGAAAELGLISLGLRRTLWAGFAADPAPLQGPPQTTSRHDVEARLALDGLSYGVRFGLSWAVARWLRVGLSARLPGRAALSGAVDLLRPCDPNQASCQTPTAYLLGARGGGATLDLALAPQLAAGVDVAPRPWLHLFLAASYRWLSAGDRPAATLDQAAVSVTQGNDSRDYPVATLPLGIALRDAGSLHAGLELALADGFLLLRLGWALLRGATDPATPSPATLDLDRHRIAAGAQTRIAGASFALSASWDVAPALQTAGAGAVVIVPLDDARRIAVGAGRYEATAARVLLEVGYGW